MDIKITIEDREWRGRTRVIEEAIDQLRMAYYAVLAEDERATVTIMLRSEVPAPTHEQFPPGWLE